MHRGKTRRRNPLLALFPWLRLPSDAAAAWRNRPPHVYRSPRWPDESWGDIVGPGWGESFKRMFD